METTTRETTDSAAVFFHGLALLGLTVDYHKRCGSPAIRRDPRACCARAVARQCVCAASFDCPTHGTVCRGSHD